MIGSKNGSDLSLAIAAPALTMPAPTAGPGRGNAPTGPAVSSMACRTSATVAPGAAWRSSAATAAAWGAAAEVPKNLHVWDTQEPKKVFAPPSVATMSGLESTAGVTSGMAGVVPLTGPKEGVPGPRDEWL